jgi:hypothetical protein
VISVFIFFPPNFPECILLFSQINLGFVHSHCLAALNGGLILGLTMTFSSPSIGQMDNPVASEGTAPVIDRRGVARPRSVPNALRNWLEQDPAPMTKIAFARKIGVSPAYVSMLVADDAPWPGREIVRRIGVVTRGAVTPNDLAGYPPGG